MRLSPFNARETDFNSDTFKRWLASIYTALTNFETINHVVIDSSSSGVVLKDTAGHYWQIVVSTSGVLSTTDLGTTKP